MVIALFSLLVCFFVLSLIGLTTEAKKAQKSYEKQMAQEERARLTGQALRLKGNLYQMNPVAFKKWVAGVYQGIGCHVGAWSSGGEVFLIVEDGFESILVGCKNDHWPLERPLLEHWNGKRKEFGANQLIAVSTGGFKPAAWDWAAYHRDKTTLVGEETLFYLCQDAVPALPLRSVQKN